MKTYMKLFYGFLGTLMLFSITAKVVHSYEHVLKQQHTKHCYHKYSKSKAEISHAHTEYDDCDECLSVLSVYLSPEVFTLEYNSNTYSTHSNWNPTQNFASFSQLYFNLRAPPVI